jgi:DNA-directed RNA polymerase subunit F
MTNPINKLSKEEIDAKVEFVLKTQELMKTLAKQIESTKAELETQYVKPVSQSEEVLGNKFKVIKTARDMGKNAIDYAKASELLKPEELKLVEKKIIDVDKLKALIKAKIIDGTVLPIIKTVSWASATSFGCIHDTKILEIEISKDKKSKTKEVEPQPEKTKSLFEKIFSK